MIMAPTQTMMAASGSRLVISTVDSITELNTFMIAVVSGLLSLDVVRKGKWIKVGTVVFLSIGFFFTTHSQTQLHANFLSTLK